MIYRDTRNISKIVGIILGILFILFFIIIMGPKAMNALFPAPTVQGMVRLYTSTPAIYPTFTPSSTTTPVDTLTPNYELTSWWLTQQAAPTSTPAPTRTPTVPAKPTGTRGPAPKFMDTPAVASRKSPVHPMINVDRQNIVHILWVDKTDSDTGDIYDTMYSNTIWSKPLNLTTEGPLPENISLQSLTILRSPFNKFLYLYWSGFPAYGDIYGGFFERRFSEGHWYGRRQVIQTLALTKFDISPSFGIDGVLHTFSTLGDPKIDWIPLDSSFKDTQFSAFDKPVLFVDRDKTFHVLSTTNSHMQDRYSYVSSEIQYRKWVKADMGPSQSYDAFINNQGQLTAVYANYDMVFNLSTFNKKTLWSAPITFDPMNGWDKTDKIVWWKVITNANFKYIIIYHKSQNFRVIDISNGQFTMTTKTLSLNPLTSPKENVDATIDDKDIIHIAAINHTDNAIYHFEIKPVGPGN